MSTLFMQYHNFTSFRPRCGELGFDEFQRPDFEIDASNHGFTRVFYCHFLVNNADWYMSFKRTYQCLQLNTKKYYIMSAEVEGDDGQTLQAYGAGYSLEIAGDAACFHLGNVMKERFPLYCMPKFLMGYPNIRGHCYVISALVPLFYCVPFVRTLTSANIQYQLGYLRGQYRTTSNVKAREEVPFFWTDLLYSVYRTFRNVAYFPHKPASNETSFVNTPELKKFRNRPHRGRAKVPAFAVLDKSLFGELIDSLAIYVNPAFRKGGGDEREAYRVMILKMASEMPEVVPNLMFAFTGTYSCSCCVGLFTDRFVTPFLRVPPGMSFQELLNSPESAITCQRFRSLHRLHTGSRCCYKVREFMGGKFEFAPQLLVFAVDYRTNQQPGIYPDELNLEVDGVSHGYIHHAISVCFPCYKSKDGLDYGEFYHPYEAGDTRVEDHTYIQIKSGNGYHEVNNGILYTSDNRIFKKTLPGSLHFYIRSDQPLCIPLVKQGSVLDNPMF